MNNQALIKAKRILYHQLLLKKPEDFTREETEIISALADDKDIQDHLEKHRQADMIKHTG